MLFNSFEFIFLFFPIVFFLSLQLRGNWLLRWICLCSIIFYAFAGQVWFIIPMLVTTVVDFFAAQKMERSKDHKKLWLYVSLVGNLGLLAYFKYSALVLHTAEIFSVRHWPWLSFFETILPAGISFYTFQTLSYIVDVYRGECKAETNFARFTGFVSFFPHLVAGPLTRHNQLIPGLADIAQNGIKPRWRLGIFFFAVGLCKKVLLGDTLGNLVDAHLLHLPQLGFFSSWLALLGYSLQIYFDFSGYSDMAIGLAHLFAIRLPTNFNEPYRALNPSDFWARWHITLSLWLRDYLYITLGGNRCSEKRKMFNLMATMVLGGLWHGANWTFAAWGIFHGSILILYHFSKPAWDKWPATLQVSFTYLLVCLGWVFFRAEDFPMAALWLKKLFAFDGLLGFQDQSLKLFLGVLAGLFCIHVLRKFRNLEMDLYWAAQCALALGAAVAFLMVNNSSKFLYFQF